MIVCPSCKEEIEDNSHYCDQCGQELVYCSSCGRVGIGRRCTHCGGLMVSVDEMQQRNESRRQISDRGVSSLTDDEKLLSHRAPDVVQMPVQKGIPTLTLYNPSLDIRIMGVNGAIIGRKQGPYQQVFEGNMYVSGVHAQLIYTPNSGWCIIDKHSSNGTKLNQRDLLPDVPMSMKAGDIVTLANINLQVSLT
ncbi:MAG: FHA domain-containing protein [Prevotella sp.]|nr:FHA domain-containing protein [Prevotella sp.]